MSRLWEYFANDELKPNALEAPKHDPILEGVRESINRFGILLSQHGPDHPSVNTSRITIQASLVAICATRSNSQDVLNLRKEFNALS
ncbi:hypothetical protein HN512_00530 [Candidatus Peregrinibacteria bacterium]|jgi:hypothetical protein|nr:hypothetical protein [Candidatus Peregrinibacteria bacterium]MBT3598311.1 hypothetical protein [Candidatus Peregrinibacteria bacterium]MBT4367039.1 hypothetical protein [Candidatus Peregrinibacteria bacterium]MBT4585719.1 hypothetical protein [Candidatus Peregrinibacteria bacterium]MBT6730527.1 hypothetical protein [Candidatus Peregrinibacteria bacterium]